MVVSLGWLAEGKTTDQAQIVSKSHNECSKETTFRGKVVAEKENLSFTVIDSFSRSRVGVVTIVAVSIVLLPCFEFFGAFAKQLGGLLVEGSRCHSTCAPATSIVNSTAKTKPPSVRLFLCYGS